MKKIFLGLLAGLTLLGTFLFLRRKYSPIAVEVITVKKQKIEKVVSASGTLKSEEDVTLKFESSGKIVWLPIKVGDSVKSYQAVASLDKKTLQISLESYESLYRKALSDQKELEETYKVEEPTNVIRENLKQAKENSEYYRLQVETAKEALKKATLATPIDGTVIELNVSSGELATTLTTAVARIANLNKIFFEAEVVDTDISELKLGQMATLVFDSFPDKSFSGNVSEIAKSATEESGGDTFFKVKIIFATSISLPLDIKGDAEIKVFEKENALAVPVDSIFQENDKDFVFVADGGRAIKRPITIIKELDELAEIEGLLEGDRVLSPTKGLKEGSRIEIKG